VSGVGSPTAFAEDTSADGPAWVGTDDGVFEIGSDPPHELGDLKNVTSLSAVTVGTPGTTTLVAVAHKEVRRWNGTAWVTIDLPEGEPGEVLVLDEKQILLGTSTGILQSTDGGPFAPIDTAKAGVIGAPVRHGNTITWLLTGGTGVLRQADAGAPWTSTPSPAIAGATSLAVDAKGMLLAPGATARVVRSSDGGKSWTALTDQPKYRPDGIVHSAEAAVIWISGCAALTVDPADAVLRLTDG
jgi:hypothetical protein